MWSFLPVWPCNLFLYPLPEISYSLTYNLSLCLTNLLKMQYKIAYGVIILKEKNNHNLDQFSFKGLVLDV